MLQSTDASEYSVASRQTGMPPLGAKVLPDVYSNGCCTGYKFIISEYIEGNQFRKAIEIYNGTGLQLIERIFP
jgi:hypothetical protein